MRERKESGKVEGDNCEMGDVGLDPRLPELCSILGPYLEEESGGLAEVIGKEPSVIKFMNNPEAKALILWKDSSGKVCIGAPGPAVPDGIATVSLSKLAMAELQQGKIRGSVLVMSGSRSQAEHLYSLLASVYNPMLASAKAKSDLRSAVGSLEALLAKELHLSLGAAREDDVSRIVSPLDEIAYWSVTEASDRALFFRSKFEPLKGEFESLIHKSFQDVIDFVEVLQDTLDEIWRQGEFQPPYPQVRMRNLLLAVSVAVEMFCREKLTAVDLWSADVGTVREALQMALQVCHVWYNSARLLTSQFWPGHSGNQWQGEAFSSGRLRRFVGRLDHIQSLRAVVSQTQSLVAGEADGDGGARLTADAFAAFSSLPGEECLGVDPHSELAWRAARSSFDARIRPAETLAANALKKRLGGRADGVVSLMHQYRDLIKRPTVSGELSAERDLYAAQVHAQLSALLLQANSGAGGGGADGLLVERVASFRHIRAKAVQFASTGGAVLQTGPKLKELKQRAGEVMNTVKKREHALLGQWVKEIREGLKRGDTALETTGQLMEVDSKDGRLVVNFSERIVQTIREVRQLSALGLKIPSDIRSAANKAAVFYRHAVTLKQVASFYNTIDSQIIPSQKPMLLEAALEFEAAVRSSRQEGRGGESGGDLSAASALGYARVRWDSEGQLEDYMSRLQAASERLTVQNRRLRALHEKQAVRVIALMGTDLLTREGKWKSVIREMRNTVRVLEEKRMDVRLWRQHWNHQLYKALEHQYCVGLESLNEALPDMSVSLGFNGRTAVFIPPLSEVQATYYGELRKFISIPQKFTGLEGEGSEIFAGIYHRNLDSLNVVYGKADRLFSKLEAIRTAFAQKIVFGNTDLRELIECNLKEASDWEYNLSMLRKRHKETQRLKDDFVVDCVKINAKPVIMAIEDQFERLNTSLISTLKTSAVKDAGKIAAYVNDAIADLEVRPQTVEEIGRANKRFAEIGQSRQDMRSLLDSVLERNKLLSSTVGGDSVDLADLEALWNVFEDGRSAFELRIREQNTALKETLKTRDNALQTEIAQVGERWEEQRPKQIQFEDATVVENYVFMVSEREKEVEHLRQQASDLGKECSYFGMPPPELGVLDALAVQLGEFRASLETYNEFKEELDKLSTEGWLAIRGKVHLFSTLVSDWDDRTRGKRDPSSMWIAVKVDLYKRVYPLLKLITGEAFGSEHWQSLFHILKLSSVAGPAALLFSQLLECADVIMDKQQQLKSLHARAQGEVTVREALQELAIWGQETEFATAHYDSEKEGEELQLVKEWKDLLTQLGEKQSLLSSLKDSPYFEPFADQAVQWETKLAALDSALHTLNATQRKFVYLEPIFGRGALPHEKARFDRVDEEFRSIMGHVAEDSRVMSLLNARQDLQGSLDMLLEQLELCQKALSAFLEEKRQKFPRFYFIGDDDLLEILGQSQNPTVIQSQLKKLFQGINAVDFSEDESKVIAMKSADGEVVVLKKAVAITENVEEWLSELAISMKDTLKALLLECLQRHDVREFPSQILCLSNEIHFCQRVEKSFGQGVEGLRGVLEQVQSELKEYTSFNPGNDRLLRLKLKSLVIDVIHQISVVKALIEGGGADDWLWQKQLRFYLGQNDECVVRMVDAEFAYTYEYQGNAQKLVHTPLTDKCFLTLTQALHLGYGGNPYGPAGTGKTESVKALASVLGRQVLVFNCDEGIDFKSMGRIFAGLIKCGAWGCFDEFNRLDEEVLSAVSQQIQVIQGALKARSNTVELLGAPVDVDFASGIFVTMNPAGKGYGGRQKLPDNLKQLFRGVVMTTPDNELIAEVMLFAEGFACAESLARKLVSLFTLAKQQLSPQQHYDWGLRALKTVLSSAGLMIQSIRHAGKQVSDVQENEICVRAARANTLSKLTFADSHRFRILLDDVFPGVSAMDFDYLVLEDAIKKVSSQRGLEVLSAQKNKMLQLYEALRQRMGVVIVGPSGSGKSTLWTVLRDALVEVGLKVRTHVINPKAMHRTQLLGNMDLDTREWSDGVLTAAARAVVRDSGPGGVLDASAAAERKDRAAGGSGQQEEAGLSWVVCDGDVDPEWVESLNSVLDDNHLLTLPSGERISFGSGVNFLFETHDLVHASPATVSRMGMIFLSEEDLDVTSVVASWRHDVEAARNKELSENSGKKKAGQKNGPDSKAFRVPTAVIQWIEDFLPRVMDWILERRSDLVLETTKLGLIYQVLSSLQPMASGKMNASLDHFALLLAQGLGACIAGREVRAGLYKFAFQFCGVDAPNMTRILDTYWDDKHSALRVTDQMASEVQMAGQQLVVMTADVKRYLATFSGWVDRGEPVLLVGGEGVGKSMLTDLVLSSVKKTSVVTLFCNSQTRAANVLQALGDACTMSQSLGARVLKPKDNERLLVVLRDINLPRADKYGTIELVALLQQLLTYRGFYDPQHLEWTRLERISFVGAVCPPSVMGRHPLTTRFTSVARICTIDEPSPEQLRAVTHALLRQVLRPLPAADAGEAADMEALAASGVALLNADRRWQRKGDIEALGSAMVDIYAQVGKDTRHLQSSQFLLTPRDLVLWARGLRRYALPVSDDWFWDAWAYEALCLIGYRLPSQKDRRHFVVLLSRTVEGLSKKQNASRILRAMLSNQAGLVAPTCCTWAPAVRNLNAARLERGRSAFLAPLVSDEFTTGIKEALSTYTRTVASLDLALTSDALAWLSACGRALSAPGSSVFMAGSAGVGRQETVVLMSSMLGFEVWIPSITHGYGRRQRVADLKTLLTACGIDGEKRMLLLPESVVDAHPQWLDAVSSILLNGEVPGVFSAEELDQLTANLKDEAAAQGFFGGPKQFYLEQLRKNLRVAICLDPSHAQFFKRCERNPVLQTRCVTLWMGEWSDEALKALPRFSFGRGFLESLGGGDAPPASDAGPAAPGAAGRASRGAAASDASRQRMLALLVDQMVSIHKSVRGASPRTFRAFLGTYQSMFTKQMSSVGEQQKHLLAGLRKLAEAAALVENLGRQAQAQKRELAEKQSQADTALQRITVSMEEAGERKKVVEVLREKLEAEEHEIHKRTTLAQEGLSKIQPIVDKAKQSVGQIRGGDIDWIKSLKMPPDGIRDVLEGVLLLLGKQDTTWMSMRKFLGLRGVKESIVSFDARQITPGLRRVVLDLLERKASSFVPENAYHASAAVGPLAEWVKANVEYSYVLERIAPLESEIRHLTADLNDSRAKLNQTEQELTMLNEKVTELRDDFKSKTAEAEALRISVSKAEATLKRAKSLLEKLGDEKNRWDSQSSKLKQELASLVQHSLLAAAFTSYLGNEPEDVRQAMVRRWQELVGLPPDQHGFDFCQFLSTESQRLEWKREGIPFDNLSLENGIIILEGSSVSLVLDPSAQASKWLAEHIKGRNVGECTYSDPKFVTVLELAVRFGKTLFINEVDHLDPLLYPLLRRDFVQQGPRLGVKIGDKIVDYNESFRLFLVARSSDIDLTPEAASLVNRVNFTVTRSGLSSQLLALTIQCEKPTLEKEKSALLQKEESLKVQLDGLERKLLTQLAQSEGNILENTELIASLDETKTKSNTIGKALRESEQLQQSLDAEREVYRPLAETGSRLFFLLKDLNTVDNMYQFALPMFVRLFNRTLKAKSEGMTNVETRIVGLQQSLQSLVFVTVSRALCKADCLLLAVHLAHGLRKDLFQPNEWEFFLGGYKTAAGGGAGGVGGDSSSMGQQGSSAYSWVPADRAAPLAQLEAAFPLLARGCDFNDARFWGEWLNIAECEKMFSPAVIRATSYFQRVLVVGALRPDRVQAALSQLACAALNLSSTSPAPFSLSGLVEEESVCTEPILFITTPGADPSQELEDFAAGQLGRDHFHQVAMGQGQAQVALALLRKCARNGDWLFLKNVHLVTGWLSVLVQELSAVAKDMHSRFRLWMTTESHPKFPRLLLQSCMKLTIEAPPGLRKNIERTYASWEQQGSAAAPAGGGDSNDSVLRHRLGFLLAWFHALVQERRTYIPQGWTSFYEFSFADLRSATDIVSLQCGQATDPAAIRWKTLRGLLGTVVYGGRVDEFSDTRILQVYLSQIFNENALKDGASAACGRPLQLRILPKSKRSQDYREMAAQLPEMDSPGMFGLPANAARSVNILASEHTLSTLSKLGISETSMKVFVREVWSSRLLPLCRYWDNLVSTKKLKKVVKERTVAESPFHRLSTVSLRSLHQSTSSLAESSLSIFLDTELVFAEEITSLVSSNLESLAACLRGDAAMSPAVFDLGSSLLQGEVPLGWESQWSGPLVPTAYLDAVARRAASLGKLIPGVRSNRLLRTKGATEHIPVLQLSCFFFPGSFLNALRQTTARLAQVSVDSLELSVAWAGDHTVFANDFYQCSAAVDDLFLQGAVFDLGRLGPPLPSTPPLSRVPPCHIMWLPKEAEPNYAIDNSTLCPVYYSPRRQRIVMTLCVPCAAGEQDSWVLAGLAMCLNA